MSAANIEVKNPSTIESDENIRRITINAATSTLVNIGDKSIFLSFNGAATIPVDSLQHEGVVEIKSDDVFPLPEGCRFVDHRCKTAETSSMWFVPSRL